MRSRTRQNSWSPRLRLFGRRKCAFSLAVFRPLPPLLVFLPARVLARDPITPHFTRVALPRQSPVGRTIRVRGRGFIIPSAAGSALSRCPTRGGANPRPQASCLPRRARLTASCPLGLARREQSQCSGTATPICMWKSPATVFSRRIPPASSPEQSSLSLSLSLSQGPKAASTAQAAAPCMRKQAPAAIKPRLSPLHPKALVPTQVPLLPPHHPARWNQCCHRRYLPGLAQLS